MDQLPRLGKRELICLLSFTCNYVVFVWRGFLFLWVLGMGYIILLWHSLSLPYNYFVFLMKAQVTRKRDILHKLFFHELCVEKCWKLMAMFHFFKIRTSIDIFKNEKCKVTFGLEYIISLNICFISV